MTTPRDTADDLSAAKSDRRSSRLFQRVDRAPEPARRRTAKILRVRPARQAVTLVTGASAGIGRELARLAPPPPRRPRQPLPHPRRPPPRTPRRAAGRARRRAPRPRRPPLGLRPLRRPRAPRPA